MSKADKKRLASPKEAKNIPQQEHHQEVTKHETLQSSTSIHCLIQALENDKIYWIQETQSKAEDLFNKHFDLNHQESNTTPNNLPFLWLQVNNISTLIKALCDTGATYTVMSLRKFNELVTLGLQASFRSIKAPVTTAIPGQSSTLVGMATVSLTFKNQDWDTVTITKEIAIVDNLSYDLYIGSDILRDSQLTAAITPEALHLKDHQNSTVTFSFDDFSAKTIQLKSTSQRQIPPGHTTWIKANSPTQHETSQIVVQEATINNLQILPTFTTISNGTLKVLAHNPTTSTILLKNDQNLTTAEIINRDCDIYQGFNTTNQDKLTDPLQVNSLESYPTITEEGHSTSVRLHISITRLQNSP